jgi:hypothetical protein
MIKSKLPDFDEMFAIAVQIKDFTYRKLILEAEISEGESKAIEYNMEHKEINGKPASMEYAKIVWKPVGLKGELVGKRKELAMVESKLAESKALFDVYKAMIAVWQTDSANKRSVNL